MEDFLQAWITFGLETTSDAANFTRIWQDMVQCAMTLPAWQPVEGRSWCRAESLAVDLMGLHEVPASILGQAKYSPVVTAMTPIFEQWASRWLKFASVAAWFAHFLPTESGQVLLPLGIKELAGVLSSFKDSDWHHHELGVLFTEAISACWKHLQNEVEADLDLRKGFLCILTDLCARQIPEALHLRNKVSETFGTS